MMKIVGIAINADCGLPCLFVSSPGRERKVNRVHDDMITHEDRAKAFVKDVLEQAERLNKNLTERQLLDEIHTAYTMVANEI